MNNLTHIKTCQDKSHIYITIFEMNSNYISTVVTVHLVSYPLVALFQLQSVYQPGIPMEFHDTHGKPGKPMEFVNGTWNFRIITFLLIHMQNLSIHT